MKKSEQLFSEFRPDWKQKIIEELKGKPFDDLIVHSNNGFDILPFYTAEDLDKIKISVPQKTKPGWETRQDFVVRDLKATNESAKKAMKGGAESIGFDVSKIDLTKSNLQKLLRGINIFKYPIHFTGVKMKSLERLVSVLNLKTPGSVQLLDFSWKNLPIVAAYAVKFPVFHFITIKGNPDSASQQLVEILKKGTTLLEQFSKSKIPLKKVLPTVRFSVSLSSDYFIEIAKLRALRFLWTKQVNQFEKIKDVPVFIHAENISQTSKGEGHYSILHTTTIAMSAIIGGCDSLVLKSLPIKGKLSDFSERIYRNVQLLLKNESYFDKVNDPARGSYYVEVLTMNLVESVRKFLI